MGRFNQVGSIFIHFTVLAGFLLTGGQSAADWSVYVAPGLGISTAVVDVDGQSGPLVMSVPTILLGGSDGDSSPLLELAVGLEVPMDELVPREWLLDLRLPSWPVRLEFEVAGLREYEFQTNSNSPDNFFSQIKATTFMFNGAVDMPLMAALKPIQYTFSLGRQPRLRRWLEPASFYLNLGIGFSALEIEGTTNVVSGDDDPIDFAWNVGLGLNYAITETVSFSTGYRYLGLGERTIKLTGGVAGANDEVDFDPQVHEFRFAIRVRVFEFFSPWR